MSEETRKAPVVVSVINLKGGVGKTTVVALLARYAARKGLNVLAVDLDPQANLSQALMTEQEYMQFMQKREPASCIKFRLIHAFTARNTGLSGRSSVWLMFTASEDKPHAVFLNLVQNHTESVVKRM